MGHESDSVSVTKRQILGRRVVASLPLILSSLALLVSFFSYQLAAVRGVKPVIVVSYSSESGWYLKNIGSGPALNVLVAQRHESAGWFCPVRVPPLGQGDELHLSWIRYTNVRWIGATYTDIDGRKYSSKCADDLTKITAGSMFPHWSEKQLGRAWQQNPCPKAG